MANERGTAFDTVGVTPKSLPTPLQSDGTYLLPHHAFVQISGGDIRWKADGESPNEAMGILVKNGDAIDWTDPFQDFQSFIQRAKLVAVNGATEVTLNISWQD